LTLVEPHRNSQDYQAGRVNALALRYPDSVTADANTGKVGLAGRSRLARAFVKYSNDYVEIEKLARSQRSQRICDAGG